MHILKTQVGHCAINPERQDAIRQFRRGNSKDCSDFGIGGVSGEGHSEGLCGWVGGCSVILLFFGSCSVPLFLCYNLLMKNTPYPLPVSVRVPPELLEKLKAEATRDQRPVSQIILFAIKAYVEGANGKK